MIATCGGLDNDAKFFSSCLVWDTSTGQWEENIIGPMLQERHWHAAVTLKDRAVYLLGGFPSSSIELLRADSTTWQQGPPLPVQMVEGPCAVVISATSFLVFFDKEIREFDTSWAKESKWPKMKTSRRWGPGCAKVGDDKVIIAGGRDGGTTDILDLSSRTLSEGGKMATPREFFHMITFNNNGDFTTLALGGSDDDGNELNTVEEWNPETESWSTVETRLKEKRENFGLVAAPKNLLCPSQ